MSENHRITCFQPNGSILYEHITSYHAAAPGWTRFAFFQYGGANFFLKTNTAKSNVNIDHFNDVLSMGTVEIGSKLDLPDAQTLNNVETVCSWTG
jgi:hypothetical protein